MNADSAVDLLLESVCSTLSILSTASVFGQFWKIVMSFPPLFLWSAGIIVVLFILKEIVMRGANSYNSANGFTPTFNKLVGSFVYFVLQALVYIIFSSLFNNSIYCLPWPYLAHLIVFALTGVILHIIGFWPELRIRRKR